MIPDTIMMLINYDFFFWKKIPNLFMAGEQDDNVCWKFLTIPFGKEKSHAFGRQTDTYKPERFLLNIHN